MNETVYVETTIFSFYHDERTSPAIMTMRQWTREWWDGHRFKYDLVTSAAVFAELEAGSLAHRDKAQAMAMDLPILPLSTEADEIVDVYIKRKVMPADPLGDALHLALASIHKVDYLVTWNCQHLANASKFGHIRRVNTLLGLHVPAIVTPLELMGAMETP